MFPIGDENSDRTRQPFVNYILIAINVLVFVVLQKMGAGLEFTYAFSTVPQEILTNTDIITKPTIEVIQGQQYQMPGLQETPIPVYLTLFTSMFMHGGWMHLLGNMVYLWVFGDNIENRLGHSRYLIFYLLTGLIASLAHVFTTNYFGDNLLIPSLGASAAISGTREVDVIPGWVLTSNQISSPVSE